MLCLIPDHRCNCTCSVHSPTRTMCVFYFVIINHRQNFNTWITMDRIVKMVVSPSSVMLNRHTSSHDYNTMGHDAITDSWHNRALHDSYVKSWSSEYFMVKFLTKSFCNHIFDSYTWYFICICESLYMQLHVHVCSKCDVRYVIYTLICHYCLYYVFIFIHYWRCNTLINYY